MSHCPVHDASQIGRQHGGRPSPVTFQVTKPLNPATFHLRQRAHPPFRPGTVTATAPG
jgi:hypothetical protein